MNATDWMLSVQLGMDFFESAAWTRSSTSFAENISVICDGGHTDNLFLQDQPDEFQYYSCDGRIGTAQFVHITNFGDTEFMPIVTIPADLSTQFAECQWCCRMFPSDGMLECPDRPAFNRFYCDAECKSHGMAIWDVDAS